jgi:hypothetical protein
LAAAIGCPRRHSRAEIRSALMIVSTWAWVRLSSSTSLARAKACSGDNDGSSRRGMAGTMPAPSTAPRTKSFGASGGTRGPTTSTTVDGGPQPPRGHHRKLAAVQTGLKTVPCCWVEAMTTRPSAATPGGSKICPNHGLSRCCGHRRGARCRRDEARRCRPHGQTPTPVFWSRRPVASPLERRTRGRLCPFRRGYRGAGPRVPEGAPWLLIALGRSPARTSGIRARTCCCRRRAAPGDLLPWAGSGQTRQAEASRRLTVWRPLR